MSRPTVTLGDTSLGDTSVSLRFYPFVQIKKVVHSPKKFDFIPTDEEV